MKELKQNGFKGYSSLTNHYSKKFLGYLDAHNCIDGQWCMTEKIHGSNFQVYCNSDTKTIRFGKRSSFIGNEIPNDLIYYLMIKRFFKSKDDTFIDPFFEQKLKDIKESMSSFYRCDLLIDKYLVDIWIFWMQNFKSSNIRLYGEIFGGNYKGMKSDGKKVQKEVMYTNKTELGIFDMEVNGKLLPYDQVITYLEPYNIFTIPIEKVGTLKELLEVSCEFNTKIPKYLNEFHSLDVTSDDYLNPLDDNVSEGYVLKPLNPNNFYLPSGSRVSLKYKSEKFNEKGKSKASKVFKPLSDTMKALIEELSKFPTNSRLLNVLSKFDKNVSFKVFGELNKLMVEDCIDEFKRESNTELVELFNNLEKSDARSINKVIGNISSTIIRDYLKEHC